MINTTDNLSEDALGQGIGEQASNQTAQRMVTRDEALTLLQKHINGVRVQEHCGQNNGHCPCNSGEDIVFSVNPDMLRRDDGDGWRADIHLSRKPCANSQFAVVDALVDLSEKIYQEEGVDIFLMDEYIPDYSEYSKRMTHQASGG